MEKHPAGYIRVSSDEQAQHGISVDAQREILKAWAVMRQAGEIALYEDPGFSGKNTDRPALRQLLADVRAGEISAVVVWKLDRLSRNLRDTLTIIEDELQPRDVALHSVTESIDTSTPSGRMMLNILASFAQLEREQDSDRVKMAHKHLAMDCRYLGGHIPLGYRVSDDRHLELDPVTAPIVRRVFEMYLSRCGYSEILNFLNKEADGFFKRTTPWKKSDLHYLLGNPVYAGIFVRSVGKEKVWIPGGVPAVISEDERQRVLALRTENRSRSFAYNARTVYPLSGLVRCGVCGALMPLRHGGKARDGSTERYYTCNKRCVKPARLEPLEAAVCASVAAMADIPDAIRSACEIADTYANGRESDNLADAAPVEQELTRVRRRLAQITDFVASSGSDAPRTLLAELRRLEAEETVLSTRLEALRRPVSRYDPDALIAVITACRNITKRPPAERRALLQEALHAILITDESYSVELAWRLCGGDDPPAYIQHLFKRPSPIFPIQLSVVTQKRGAAAPPETHSPGSSSWASSVSSPST